MRAWVFEEFGGPLELREVPDPDCPADGVVVRVERVRGKRLHTPHRGRGSGHLEVHRTRVGNKMPRGWLDKT